MVKLVSKGRHLDMKYEQQQKGRKIKKPNILPSVPKSTP